ncbi:MAG: SusD/RagB family nutrient-binding outer membrane lipoprotein [Bacteroidetes bacterium]|nr:MAG: SusD/RagB family nutrient-binding outer membrane lipoprotein [Bacteroidota bacterium]
MNRKNIFRGLALALVVGGASCKKYDFGDFNVNPSPVVNSRASTAELFTNVMVATGYGNATNSEELGYFVQYFMNINYPNLALYQTTNLGWNGYYTGMLMDCQTIIDLNNGADASNPKVSDNGSKNNQLATARILKAYFFSLVTDKWGNVPYSQALSLNIAPTYDLQSNIYPALITELKEAEAQFDNGATVKGDILLNGNIGRWKKFANSLRMVLAMRMAVTNPTLARTEFVAAIQDADGYIQTNADNVFYQPLVNINFSSFWFQQYRNRDEVGMSSTFINALRTNNDRRLAVFSRVNNAGQYVGIPYGRSAAFLNTWKASNDYSRLGAAITAFDCKANIITASQMLLTRAEAEIRGWIGSPTDAAASYRAAIRASWEQWNVTFTQAELDAYTNGANVIPSQSVTDMIAKIGTQKWIALYPNGHEAWSEWRRLASPVLTPAQDAINDSRQIPRRYAYPLNEPQLNAAAYNAAIGLLPAGDTHDGRVWWDRQ